MSKLQHQSGQVGIVVLLLSSIILVIGLTVANRVLREGQSTAEQEDSIRIFNTAETGIEEALNDIYEFEKNGTELSGRLDLIENDNLNQVTINTTDNFEGFIQRGEVLSLEVIDGQTGNIEINWSRVDCAQGASNLLIGVYYNDSGSYQSDYYMVGNCPSYADQNLISVTDIAEENHFRYLLPITDANNQNAFVRISPIEAGTDIDLNVGPGLLGDTQYNITSIAQNQSGSNAKVIEVSRSSLAAPSFMDYALVSGGNLTK